MKKPIPSEHQEQAALIQWTELKRFPYNLIFAIPNGANKTGATAAKFQAEGLKAGVPDLFLPHAVGEFNGLFVEMKRVSGSKTSPAQTDWHDRLRHGNYAVAVCYGCDEAIAALTAYVSGEWTQ